MEDKPLPVLDEQEPKKEQGNPVFFNYIFKPGLIGSIICLVLWVVGACVAAGFGIDDSNAVLVAITNVAKTLTSIATMLLWLLFLPALIVGIIFVSKRRK